jgi:NAD(P)-dependent dehydrogenase (short-subunit alcohol dehydrogenase family)
VAGERPAALVTGGGSGIGLASAIALAQAGWDVAVSGRRANVLDEAVAAINAAAPDVEAVALPGDVGDGDAAVQLVADAIARFGRLDGLVNSAGAYEARRFDEIEPADWDRITNVLLRGTALASIAAAKHMAERGKGRIVFIGSVSGMISEPESAHYAAAKAGMHSLARSITVDLGERGVIANVVASGFVATPMTSGLTEHPDQDMVKGIYQRLNPLRRAGRPEEIASLVRYLVVDAPDYLAGATIPVDGGQTVMATIH